MIKSIVRSLIFVVLLCVVGGYLFYAKTGEMPTPDNLLGFLRGGDVQVDLSRLPEMPFLNSIGAGEQAEDIIKWQDENGVWHFSNKKKID